MARQTSLRYNGVPGSSWCPLCVRPATPVTALTVSVMRSVRDFGTDRLLWTVIVTEKSFHIFSRLNFSRMACVCKGFTSQDVMPTSEDLCRALRSDRSLWKRTRSVHLRACGMLLPLPSIDSVYQRSNTLLKKNYCLVSGLV